MLTWNLRFLLLIVAAVCGCVPRATFASTLYEDQYGSTSWIKEFIGEIQYAELAQSISAFLISSDRALAAISSADGSLLWRRETQVGTIHVFDSSHRVATVYESEIHLWSLPSGQLLWSTSGAPNDTVKVTCQSADVLVYLQSGHASLLDLQTGRIRWSVPLPTFSSVAFCAVRAKDVVVATVGGESQCYIWFAHLEITSGDVIVAADSEVDRPLSAQGVVINGTLVAVSDDLQQLCTVDARTMSASCTSLPVTASGLPVIHATECSASISIPALEGTMFFIVILLPQPRFLPLPSTTFAVSVSASCSAPSILALQHVDANERALVISVIDASSGAELRRKVLAGYPAVHVNGMVAQPAAVWVGSAAHDNITTPILLKAEDMSLWYSSGVEWLWGRDEALAAVADMAFVEVARQDAAAAFAPIPSHRHSALCNGVNESVSQYCLTHVRLEESMLRLQNRVVKYFNMAYANDTKQKLLVAACQNGMFYALDAIDGGRVWAEMLQPHGMSLVNMETYTCFRGVYEDIQLLVVFSGSQQSVAMFLDPSTGSIQHMNDVPHRVTHVHALDRGQCEHSGVLLAGISGSLPQTTPVFVFPNHTVVSQLQGTRLWAADHETGNISGYEVLLSQANDTGPDYMSAERCWKFSLRGNLLAAVPVTRPPHSGYHVKISGDRSMKYRYLSPNMVLVISQTLTAGVDAASGLTFAILDTASGHVMHSQFQASASGPVAAAFYENVAVIHFYDQVSLRWQITTMELYDSSTHGPSTLQMLWGTVTGTIRKASNVVATNPTLLSVSRNSVFSQMGVRAMHPIQTRFGVAPKHVLMITSTDQIYNLDTKFINSDRTRTSRMHASHQGHGNIQAQLAVLPQWFATYNRTISTLRSIRTSPSQLESTVHLMAWGSDVYYAELRPSHGFDTLGDDFSFVLLLLAMASMGVAVTAMSHLVQSSNIGARWE